MLRTVLKLFSTRRPFRSCKANALIGLAGGLALTASFLAFSGRSPLAASSGIVSGTVLQVDAPALHLYVKSDEGRFHSLAIANVDAVRDVHAGDHVQLDTDGNGVVLNINKLPAIPRPISYSRG